MDRDVVIVTGASRGLGKEIALAFGRAGWAVVVNYLNSEDEAAAVAQEIRQSGGRAEFFKADVSDYSQVEEMVNETLSIWGWVNVLVNNAGISTDAPIRKTSEEIWDEIVDTDLKGCFNTIKAVSKPMLRQKAGHIINISSIAGVKGRAGLASYSSAKAGLIGLSKAAAFELGHRGVQVNAVLPGFMKTDMGSSTTRMAMERAVSDNILRRFSDPAEVAAFILHLVGMKAVSGQVFNLDSRVM